MMKKIICLSVYTTSVMKERALQRETKERERERERDRQTEGANWQTN